MFISRVVGFNSGVNPRSILLAFRKSAFNRIYDYVEYKAAAYDVDVAQVEPENTSHRCSHCGFTHPDDREGEDIECLKCGYENHADYNAAKNIGLRYLRRNQTGSGGGAPLGVRLNSAGPLVPHTMRTGAARP